MYRNPGQHGHSRMPARNKPAPAWDAAGNQNVKVFTPDSASSNQHAESQWDWNTNSWETPTTPASVPPTSHAPPQQHFPPASASFAPPHSSAHAFPPSHQPPLPAAVGGAGGGGGGGGGHLPPMSGAYPPPVGAPAGAPSGATEHFPPHPAASRPPANMARANVPPANARAAYSPQGHAAPPHAGGPPSSSGPMSGGYGVEAHPPTSQPNAGYPPTSQPGGYAQPPPPANAAHAAHPPPPAHSSAQPHPHPQSHPSGHPAGHPPQHPPAHPPAQHSTHQPLVHPPPPHAPYAPHEMPSDHYGAGAASGHGVDPAGYGAGGVGATEPHPAPDGQPGPETYPPTSHGYPAPGVDTYPPHSAAHGPTHGVDAYSSHGAQHGVPHDESYPPTSMAAPAAYPGAGSGAGMDAPPSGEYGDYGAGYPAQNGGDWGWDGGWGGDQGNYAAGEAPPMPDGADGATGMPAPHDPSQQQPGEEAYGGDGWGWGEEPSSMSAHPPTSAHSTHSAPSHSAGPHSAHSAHSAPPHSAHSAQSQAQQDDLGTVGMFFGGGAEEDEVSEVDALATGVAHMQMNGEADSSHRELSSGVGAPPPPGPPLGHRMTPTGGRALDDLHSSASHPPPVAAAPSVPEGPLGLPARPPAAEGGPPLGPPSGPLSGPPVGPPPGRGSLSSRGSVTEADRPSSSASVASHRSGGGRGPPTEQRGSPLGGGGAGPRPPPTAGDEPENREVPPPEETHAPHAAQAPPPPSSAGMEQRAHPQGDGSPAPPPAATTVSSASAAAPERVVPGTGPAAPRLSAFAAVKPTPPPPGVDAPGVARPPPDGPATASSAPSAPSSSTPAMASAGVAAMDAREQRRSPDGPRQQRSETIGSEDRPAAVAPVASSTPAAAVATPPQARRGDGEDEDTEEREDPRSREDREERRGDRYDRRGGYDDRGGERRERGDRDRDRGDRDRLDRDRDRGDRDRDRDRDRMDRDRDRDRDRMDPRDRDRDRGDRDRDRDRDRDDRSYYERRHRYDSVDSRREDDYDRREYDRRRREDPRYSRDEYDDPRRRRDRRREREDVFDPDRSRPHSRAGSERDYGDRPPSRSHSHYSHYSHRDAYPTGHHHPHQQHAGYYAGRERERARPSDASFYGHNVSTGYPAAAAAAQRSLYDERTLYNYFMHLERLRGTNPQLFTQQMSSYRTNNPPFYRELCQRHYPTLLQTPAAAAAAGTPYGGYPASEERASVHSGRSSVDGDDDQKDNFARDFGQHRPGSALGYEPSTILNESMAASEVSYRLRRYEETTAETKPERLTPAKFAYPHVIVRFSATGQLVRVLPHSPADGSAALVEIHDTQALLQHTPEAAELKRFPGPLVKNDTHKNSVLQFCQQKMREAQEQADLVDKESCILVWRLLLLLIRQNGMVVGSDMAELLLRDGDPVSSGPPSAGALTGSEDGDGASDGGGSRVGVDRSLVTRAERPADSRAVARFTELLLYGHRKEALEWAMKQGIWGHALFLASKMDQRTYGQVMTRFANGLLQNDPLQTLYQLMSGRQPSCTTSCADERWGDWRPHLAMILSNATHRPELNQRAIVTLGDTLASRGLLHAAHFCYLMAQCEFGPFERKSSKLVLIGSAHQLPWAQFATNEAIQRTEVFEYAQSLGAADYVLTHLQAIKFIYATRLAEVGLITECLHYCEVIGGLIAKYPTSFNYALVSRVYALASRLKYHDAHYQSGEGELSELGDPEWLLALQNVLVDMQNGRIAAYPQPADSVASTPVDPSEQQQHTDQATADQHLQYQQQQQQQQQEYGTAPAAAQTPAQDAQAGAGATYDPSQYAQQPQQPSTDPNAAAPYDPAAYQGQGQAGTFVPEDQADGGGQDYWGGWGYASTPIAPGPGQDNGIEGAAEASQGGQTDASPPPSAGMNNKNFSYWDQQQQRKMTDHNLSNLAKRSSSLSSSTNQQSRRTAAANRRAAAAARQPIGGGGATSQPISSLDTPTGVGGSGLRRRGVAASRASASAAAASNGAGAGGIQTARPAAKTTAPTATPIGRRTQLECRPPPLGDGTVRTYPVDEPCCAPPNECREHARTAPPTAASASRHRPSTASATTEEEEEDESDASSAGSDHEQESSRSSAAPPPTSSANQSGAGAPSGDQSGGGWFGGLFSRLGKPKNQMKLPDDKEKSIVYDPATKRWVDKDAGPDDGPQAPVAPPSDSQLIGGGGGSGGGPPSMGAGPGGPPPPMAGGGNKFKIPKGRGVRSNYVDVFGGSGGPSPGPAAGASSGPPSLPPLVPSPGPIPPAEGLGQDLGAPQPAAAGPGDAAPPPGAAPPMFNPGQMGGVPAPAGAPRGGRLNRYGRR